MNNAVNFPDYLTPVAVFTGALEVVGEIREKTDKEGNRKLSPWNSMPGWVVPIEYVKGTKTKSLPSGETVESMNLVQMNVTVWGAQPVLRPGVYAVLENPAVGAVDGNLFVQATGIKAYESLSALDDVLGAE